MADAEETHPLPAAFFPANPEPVCESFPQISDSAFEGMLAARTPLPRAGWRPLSVEELQARLPQYEIRGLIGRGGMGAVYKGWQRNLDRFVAIKVLPTGLMGEEVDFAARFQREAKAMAKLKHPGIIPVHDAGETGDGLLYFVMDFVEGTDLQKLLAARGRLPPEVALPITSCVLDALAYAHQRGIIHRDIKPANIMLDTDGHVLVADFGLAGGTGPDATMLTVSRVAMGTPDFMAPESLLGLDQVDQRADLYAVGVMLYQMLTGKIPRGRFDAPSRAVPGLDKRLDRIIDRTLHQERDERYSSAIELRSDLEPVLTWTIVRSAASTNNASQLRKKPLLFALCALTVVAALIHFAPWNHGGAAGGIRSPGTQMSETLKPVAVRAEDPVYPVGRWVDAWSLMKESAGPSYQEEEGWIVPSENLFVAHDPRLAGHSFALRATFRYGGDANRFGQVTARHQVTADRKERDYRVRLKYDSTATRLLVHDATLSQGSSNEIVLAERPLPTSLAAGEAYTVQLLVMGNHLIAWHNGARIGEATDVRLTDGGAGILTGEAFRDFQVMNLDGLSEAEALRLAGVSPSLVPTNAFTFGGHRYLLVRERLSWPEAKAKAEAMGGHLATVTSKQEDECLIKTFGGSLPKEYDGMHIGGLLEGTQWKWLTGEPFVHTNWLPDCPNGKGNSHSLQYMRKGTSVGWDDRLDHSPIPTVGFLVEWDGTGNPKP